MVCSPDAASWTSDLVDRLSVAFRADRVCSRVSDELRLDAFVRGVEDSAGDCFFVTYQRATTSASVTRKVIASHGNTSAIGSSTCRIRLLRLADARSALTVYRVMMPTPNATSGGWAAAVNSARRRTSRAAATHPTRKQNLNVAPSSSVLRASIPAPTAVITTATRTAPHQGTPRTVGSTDCWSAGTADAVRCAENTSRRYR